MTATDKTPIKQVAPPVRRSGKRAFRRLIAALLLLAAVASGGYALWRSVRKQVLASPQYVVRAEDVTITPPPKWIRSDIKNEVFSDITLAGPISVLDDDLGERFYEAFAAHPWVSKVARVLKRPPAGVEIDLVYRRPVLMLQIAEGLLPIDGQGVQLLTADFSPLEASRYPRLEIAQTTPPPAGTRWTDARVVAAASLAAVLIDAWDELGLHHLALSNEPSGTADQFEFDLYTKRGTRVAWGVAPGTWPEEQAKVPDKLARLRQYHAERGTLDGPRGPQTLDLRAPHGVQVAPRTASRPREN